MTFPLLLTTLLTLFGLFKDVVPALEDLVTLTTTPHHRSSRQLAGPAATLAFSNTPARAISNPHRLLVDFSSVF